MQSEVTATAFFVPCTRTRPASAPVALSARVSAMTWRSYCSQSHRLEAMSGQPISFSTASFQSDGGGTRRGSIRAGFFGWV